MLIFLVMFACSQNQPVDNIQPVYMHTWDCSYTAPIKDSRYSGKEPYCNSNETNYVACKKIFENNQSKLTDNIVSKQIAVLNQDMVKESIDIDSKQTSGKCTYRIQYLGKQDQKPEQIGFQPAPEMDLYLQSNIPDEDSNIPNE